MQTPYTIILAPNPSIMTGPGTNTIILGEGAEGATVIDPAIDDSAYLDMLIIEGLRRGGIRRILITHGHHDHIDGAAVLRERLGVQIYAFSREGVPIADEEIGDGNWLVAGWTQPARAETAAEETALGAILITEIPGLAGRAFVYGA